MVIFTWLLKLLNTFISFFEGQPPPSPPPIDLIDVRPDDWARDRKRFRNR